MDPFHIPDRDDLESPDPKPIRYGMHTVGGTA
jgi:hypothetical protein